MASLTQESEKSGNSVIENLQIFQKEQNYKYFYNN